MPRTQRRLWRPSASRSLLGAILAGVAALWCSASSAKVSYKLSAEAGPEIDSNATRLPSSDQDDHVASGLVRMVANGSLSLRSGRQRLTLAYGGGGKVFLSEEARQADELVQRARAGWGMALGKRTSMWVLGGYYDAFQRLSNQDFRTGTWTWRMALGSASDVYGALDIGYQGLEFKPLQDYSFHGVLGGLSLGTRIVPDRVDEISWRISASYAAALRGYSGPILGSQRRDPCAEAPDSPTCGEHRRDLAHTIGLSADYAGNAVARLWYAVEINNSNSFGESFIRHAIGIKFTTLVCWGIYLTTKGVLRFSRFSDPFLVVSATQSRFIDIDDENRSTLLLHLARDVSKRLSLVLRYSLHVNESTGGDDQYRPPGFLRHLLFVGARFRLNSDGEE